MFYLVIQTGLLVLAAFVLGAIAGCLLKRFFTGGSVYQAASAAPAAVSSEPEPAAASPAPVAKKRKPRPAESAAAVAAATVAATTAHLDTPEEKPAVRDPVSLPEPADEMDEAAVEAALAALPTDASNEDKANAVGTRPSALAGPTGGTKDNLQRIKGVGKVNEGKLNDLGIYHFAQIAEWTPSEARWVGTYLAFAGRIEREDWVGQAKVLADGGETDFAKRVDAGKVESSSSKTKK
ncbi:MAG: hypothetical protein ACFB01_06795 [Cohaesibacteraceae bacterium]